MSGTSLYLVIDILATFTAFFLIRFKLERKAQSKLLLKYEDLLKPMLAEKKIHLKESNLRQLIINYREAKTLTTFALYESENKLFVTWAHNSTHLGNRGKEWCFQQDGDQQIMRHQIQKDIEGYLKQVRN